MVQGAPVRQDWEKEHSTLAMSVPGSRSIYHHEHSVFASFPLMSGLLFSVLLLKSSFDTVSPKPSSGFIIPLNRRAQ